MDLQDVIKNCDINFKVGDKIEYTNPYGIEKEGIIRQINLILDSPFVFVKGSIEYLVEYDPDCRFDRVFEEDMIKK